MHTCRDGDFIVVTLGDDIDLANVEPIAAQLLRAVPDDAAGLVVDLSAVRYIDSTGAHMLFDLARTLGLRRQRLAVALSDSSPLRPLLKMMNVNDVVPVAATTAQAIEGLRCASDGH